MKVGMTAERWRDIERLFHDALNCEADQRAAFLASACAGDEELWREVNSLLVARDQARGFISENALQIMAREIAADDPASIAVEPENQEARAVNLAEATASSPSHPWWGRARIFKMMLGVLTLVALGAAAFYWPISSRREARGTAPALQPAESQAECRLSYSMTVRRNPKLFPNGRPFSLPGEILFGQGDRVRLQLSVTHDGFLYIVNQSPEERDGLPLYNVLFPNTITSRGSAAVRAAYPVQIPQPSSDPGSDWFELDGEQGAETVWLIWSAAALPELEAVKGWANPRDEGVIGDAGGRRALFQFLTAQTPPPPQMDEAEQRTVFKANGSLIVGRVKLEHH
ncbi:MAG TPA: DUF4384 domain-containing protein [Blastocatellia bacterium]|nr:DUF4384 domain-containing protein [Blastocatellia bacterium]